MRVVFLEDVDGVARGGDVKEVRNGFARNYLIPKNLAVPATHNALQRVGRLAKEAEVERLQRLEDMRALAQELDGTQVNIEMRAGSGGRLYGSVTNTIVAEELSRLVGREIDRRIMEIAEPIRQLGTFQVNVRLDPEVEARINVLVYATGTDPTAQGETDEGEETGEAEAEPAPIDAAPSEGEAEGSDGDADDTE
jgi:large subunit ribosomal protein L9